jgi:hypothetical protein
MCSESKARKDPCHQVLQCLVVSRGTYVVRPEWLDEFECVETRAKDDEESYDYRLV